MSATSVRMDMATTKKMILKDMDCSGSLGTSKVIAHANGKGCLWILWEHTPIGNDPYITARCCLISHSKGQTTYKEIDIDYHPYYYDCPQSWLVRIQPQGEMGMEWLAKAKNHTNMMSIEIKPGMTFRSNLMHWTVEYKYSPMYWTVRNSHGKLYKMKNASIKEALSID